MSTYFLGEKTFEIDVANETTELTHRTGFTERSSIRARVNVQHYQ